MSTIKQLKNRIGAVSSAKKITETMNMIASARFLHVKKLLRHAHQVEKSLFNTVKNIIPDTLTDNYSEKKQRYIVLGTDKSLCGGFNTKIYKFIVNYIDKGIVDAQNLIVLGEKLSNLIDKINNFGEFSTMPIEMQYSDIFYFAECILNQAVLDGVNELNLIYNRFHTALNIEPCAIKLHLKQSIDKDLSKVVVDDEGSLITLHNQYLLYKIYTSLLSSKVGEQSSRMIAMNSSAKNCSDLIDTLTLQMNKVRQANITGELIEIISSSQAIT